MYCLAWTREKSYTAVSAVKREIAATREPVTSQQRLPGWNK
jgi:hypothetical protein